MKPRKKTKPKAVKEVKAEVKQETKPEVKPEPAQPTQQERAGQTKPHRGMWELELEEAEKENDEGKGRKWFNGRPIRQVVKKLEDAFTIGGTVKEACSHAEISQATYYDFLKDKPYLAEHFDHCEDRLTITSLFTVAKSVPTNVNMAWNILQTRMARRYAETKNVNIDARTTSFSISAQLMALKKEFDKRVVDEINQADIKGQIPPDSDDFVMEPPKELIDKAETKVVELKEQGGGEVTSSGS